MDAIQCRVLYGHIWQLYALVIYTVGYIQCMPLYGYEFLYGYTLHFHCWMMTAARPPEAALFDAQFQLPDARQRSSGVRKKTGSSPQRKTRWW